jgi:3-dehydroquinate dehydratase type I
VAQTTKAPHKPCILGIVTADMLVRRRYPDALWRCGGVELRADGVPADAIAGAVSDFDNEKGHRGFSGPVIFTLRLQRDGGAWADADSAARNEIWESLPPGTCDWIDLEVEELSRIAPETLDELRSSGAKILLSHHAFVPEDPAVWEAHLKTMRAFQPDGVKFAVALRDQAQAEALIDFTRGVAAEFPESCVLGMGEAGSLTRLVGPLLGCPFTYGFLGDGAVAPGQLPVQMMANFFTHASSDAALSDNGKPAPDAPATVWLDWARALLAKVNSV